MRNPFSLPAQLLSWFLALSFLVACGGKEPIDPTPPTPPTPTVDTKAPVISVSLSSVNVIGGQEATLGTSELKIGTKTVATWKDDVSKTCKAGLELDGKAISSGTKLSEPGKLKLTVTDEAGNSSSTEITLTKTDSQAPEIQVKIAEKNVVAGVKVNVEGDQLFFDDQVAASWKDDYSETLTVNVQYFPENSSTGKAIESGETLFDAGKLQIAVQDDAKNKSTAEIKLTSVAITGLESLMGKELTVDVPVNLLEGLTIAEGLTLQKVEIEQDGQRSEIANPKAFSPQIPGTIGIVLTLARTDGSTIEVKVDNLTVKGIQYQTMKITDLKPVEILPIIGQIEGGDKNAYDHIDHLRVAEATRIRDMMWKYGTGKHSPEQYQQLMMRLNTGMIQEYPKWYSNFEFIGTWEYGDLGDNHAHIEWSILNSLLNHVNMKCVLVTFNEMWWDKVEAFIRNNPDAITILGCSTSADDNKEDFINSPENAKVKELCKSRRLIIFKSGGNIRTKDWVLLTKTYQKDVDGDEHWRYHLASLANWKNDSVVDMSLLISVWTNAQWDADQTGETTASSRFPVWFHNKVLFAWRAFPYHSLSSWTIAAEGSINNGKYATSYVNYVNVAIMDICFQMFAEVKDVDELLEMVRSTCLTDCIRLDLNWDGDTNDTVDNQPETQPLQLMNPAWFFKEYSMKADVPSSISINEVVNLGIGYYKGLIFNIPGSEVLVNGEWIAFTAENASRIKATNPMNLEWRINGALLRKYGHTPGQTIQGQIITVDDQWNGLRLEKDFTIQVK